MLAQEDVRVELALHAERSARLERMQRLAEAGDYGSLAVRIRMLMEYEDARHQQRMDDSQGRVRAPLKGTPDDQDDPQCDPGARPAGLRQGRG